MIKWLDMATGGRCPSLRDPTVQELRDALAEAEGALASVCAQIRARRSAADLLDAGAAHIRDRAASRDQANGERTMGQVVGAFNAVYGTQLTEEQGWQFMTLIKLVRSGNGTVCADDYEDGAAYFALAGEAALRDRGAR